MKAAIDTYLLTRFPKIWKSKIHWVLIVSLFLSFLFLLFADVVDTEIQTRGTDYKWEDEGNDVTFFGGIPIMIWSGIVLFWLFIQSKQKLALTKYDFLEITSVNTLNLVTLAATSIPLIALMYFSIDTENDFESLVAIVGFLSFFALIPIAFASMIIRYFSLIEIILIIAAGFFYCLFTGFMIMSILFSSDYEAAENAAFIFFNLNYLVLLFFVLYKFLSQQFTHTHKRLAFALIFFTPWFIFGNAVMYYDRIKEESFGGQTFWEAIQTFSFYTLLLLVTLSIISWVITKTIQKPITIK